MGNIDEIAKEYYRENPESNNIVISISGGIHFLTGCPPYLTVEIKGDGLPRHYTDIFDNQWRQIPLPLFGQQPQEMYQQQFDEMYPQQMYQQQQFDEMYPQEMYQQQLGEMYPQEMYPQQFDEMYPQESLVMYPEQVEIQDEPPNENHKKTMNIYAKPFIPNRKTGGRSCKYPTITSIPIYKKKLDGKVKNIKESKD